MTLGLDPRPHTQQHHRPLWWYNSRRGRLHQQKIHFGHQHVPGTTPSGSEDAPSTMETSKTRSTLAGLPPRELLASFGLPPDALDLMMDDDEMALRVLVLTRGAVILGLQLTSGANFDQDKLNKIEDPLLL